VHLAMMTINAYKYKEKHARKEETQRKEENNALYL